MLSVGAAAQFRYAPVVGVNISDLKFKQDLFATGNTVGVQAGVMGELMFPGIGFGMDFGLLYNMIGSKTDIGERKIWAADGFRNCTATVHTLEHTAAPALQMDAHERLRGYTGTLRIRRS